LATLLKKLFRVWVLAGIVVSATPLALAHGGHDPRLKISLSETEIRIETSLDIERFLEFDTNGDGALSVAEYNAQYEIIAIWIDQNLKLLDFENSAVTAYFSDAPIIDRAHLSKTDAIENIKILRRYKLVQAEAGSRAAWRLYVDIFDHDPDVLYMRSGAWSQLAKFEICQSSRFKNQPDMCLAP